MTMDVERAFLTAVEDLNAGREKPAERYLELVSRSEQEALADLLAMVFASRPPAVSETPSLESPSYQRALAALDAVNENAGQTGILPGTLVSLRRVRGLLSHDVTDRLAEQFGIGEHARRRLERLYHRLEAGKLSGRKLSRRLLAALAEIFGVELEDFLAASEQVPSPARRPSVVMARSAGKPASPSPKRIPTVREEPDAELDTVDRLFQGGRDA